MYHLPNGKITSLYVFFFQENVNPPCEMTERRLFTMAKQVASALVSMLINMSSLFLDPKFDLRITDIQ